MPQVFPAAANVDILQSSEFKVYKFQCTYEDTPTDYYDADNANNIRNVIDNNQINLPVLSKIG